MNLSEQTMLTARALRLSLRKLPYVRGRGRIEYLLERIYRRQQQPVMCRTAFGSVMCVDPLDPGPQSFIWRLGVYEPATSALLIRVLSARDVFYDVGAHVGYYTCLAGRRVTEGRVVAVEPCDCSHRVLTQNVRANGLANVEVLHRAIWHCSGEVVRVGRQGAAAALGTASTHVLHQAAKESEAQSSVATISIDDITRETGQVPTFIKIDVEGAEREAMEGARETLRRHKPVLIVEHNDETAAAFGYSLTELFRELQARYLYRLFAHRYGRYSNRPDLVHRLG